MEAETWRWIAKNRLCLLMVGPRKRARYGNKRKSMTCPEEEAYVDMLHTTDLLSRDWRFTPQILSSKD